jgi:hypothetical protein
VRILIDGQIAWERASLSSLDAAQAVVIPIPKGSSLLTLETGPDQGTIGIAAFAKAGFVK